MKSFDHAALFPTTHWSTVRRAQDVAGDDGTPNKAIDTLCATYWRPICRYIVYLGIPDHDARDLTQEFFHRLVVGKNLFLQVRKESGKLRTFVCVAVRRLVADEIRKRNRQKRGGGMEDTSLDELDPHRQPTDPNSPDRQFDLQWAQALVERALTELEADYRARGKHALFLALRPFLSGDRETESHQAIADELQISVNNVSTQLQRLRQRYGTTFRQKVAETVPGGVSAEVDAEIVYLMGLV